MDNNFSSTELTFSNKFSIAEKKKPLSVTAQRIEAFSIMQVDTFSSDDFPTIIIDRNLLISLGVPQGIVKRELEKASDELLNYEITIIKENGNILKTHLCSGVETLIKGYKYKLSFHPDLKPLFLKIKGDFTQLSFDNVLGITNSSYSYDLYKFLASSYGRENYKMEKKGLIGEKVHIKIDLDQLRRILGCQDKYRLAPELKRNVIKPSALNISKNTDLKVTFKDIKNGRFISGILFTLEKQEFTPFFNFNPPVVDETFEIPEPVSKILASLGYEAFGKAEDFILNIISKYSEGVVIAALNALDSDLSGLPKKVRGGAVKNRLEMYIETVLKNQKSSEEISQLQLQESKKNQAKAAYKRRLDSLVEEYLLFKDISSIEQTILQKGALNDFPEEHRDCLMKNFVRYEVEQLIISGELGTEADFIKKHLNEKF